VECLPTASMKPYAASTEPCHPERSEGSWFSPAQSMSAPRANTRVPRFARDDKRTADTPT
ncbi:MAG: hypothetical protein WA671_02810, partial [Candidatus Sulfotelmatobacter sp.]